MSLSLVAVFIPFQLLGGIVGKLFREFTVTLSVAILISLVISLTTTPMMCARLLGRDRARASQSRFAQRVRARLRAAARRRYEHTLGWALDHRALMMLILLLTVGAERLSVRRHPQGILARSRTPASCGAASAATPSRRSSS